jgi:hypothetical protein
VVLETVYQEPGADSKQSVTGVAQRQDRGGGGASVVSEAQLDSVRKIKF